MKTDPAMIPGRNCEGADLNDWFPPKDAGNSTHYAGRLCGGCPALDVCLEFALHVEAGTHASSRHGIFGGKTPSQRAKIDRERKGKAA